MKTADCAKVWELIEHVKTLDTKLGDELADAFCDFECAWEAQAREYHTDDIVETANGS